MSYADDTAFELSAIEIKKNCCLNAYLSGIFLSGNIEGDAVSVRFNRADSLPFLVEILTKKYGNRFQQAEETIGKNHFTVLTVHSPSLREKVSNLQSNIDTGCLQVCPNCTPAFLRGVFLSNGNLSRPSEQSAHLEICAKYHRGEAILRRVLTDSIAKPMEIQRGKHLGFYYKKSGTILDFLGYIGLHHLIYDFYDEKIKKEIRNNENRATNCVTKNIEKSVLASQRQVELISGLLNGKGKCDLSDELTQTAKLRVENPDVTLEMLAELHCPPITKSGLYHRLKKLEELAKKENGHG